MISSNSKVALFELIERGPCLYPSSDRPSHNILLNYNIVWHSSSRGLHIYDLSIPVSNKLYSKKPAEALQLHCEKGPLLHLIRALLRDLPPKSKLFVFASLAEKISIGITSLIKLLLENKGHYQSLHIILKMPLWRHSATTHIIPLFQTILQILKTYLLEEEPRQVCWIIVEEESIIRSQGFSYLDFLSQFDFSSNKVFILYSHLMKPYIWGLYEPIFEEQAVQVIVPTDEFSKCSSISAKMVCLNGVPPGMFFEVIQKKLTNLQDVFSDYNRLEE